MDEGRLAYSELLIGKRRAEVGSLHWNKVVVGLKGFEDHDQVWASNVGIRQWVRSWHKGIGVEACESRG